MSRGIHRELWPNLGDGVIEYMRDKGDVWFARLDEISGHVRKLVAEGVWQPRRDTVPRYHSPIPELSRDWNGSGFHRTTNLKGNP